MDKKRKTFYRFINGVQAVFSQLALQQYNNGVFTAGIIDDTNQPDCVFFTISIDGEEDVVITLRSDEANALISLISHSLMVKNLEDMRENLGEE
jgi:hypothetical protein